MKELLTLVEIETFLLSLPEGTTSDVDGINLVNGNFKNAHFELPDGSTEDVHYTGRLSPTFEFAFLD